MHEEIDSKCKFCGGTGLEASRIQCRVCKGMAYLEFVEVTNNENICWWD